jgi:hypothetical protein
MHRQFNGARSLGSLSEPDTDLELIFVKNPSEVMAEVKKVILSIFPVFDFIQIDQVFHDILRLFRGEYPGYRRCNTSYHDLTHTMECFLVMAKLIHGAFVDGFVFAKRDVGLGLISALMHDTGYIQTVAEINGTGAKHTLHHIQRSIEFMEKYFHDHNFPSEYSPICRNFLRCTGLDVKIAEIEFDSREHKILGQMLGTADLIGQMADRHYLKKLHFLYNEFKEGGVPGFTDEIDFLKKTPGFWETVKKRFELELGQVDFYLRHYFRARHGIDRDLYRVAIDRNIQRLQSFLQYREASKPNFPTHNGHLRMSPTITKNVG